MNLLQKSHSQYEIPVGTTFSNNNNYNNWKVKPYTSESRLKLLLERGVRTHCTACHYLFMQKFLIVFGRSFQKYYNFQCI